MLGLNLRIATLLDQSLKALWPPAGSYLYNVGRQDRLEGVDADALTEHSGQWMAFRGE